MTDSDTEIAILKVQVDTYRQVIENLPDNYMSRAELAGQFRMLEQGLNSLEAMFEQKLTNLDNKYSPIRSAILYVATLSAGALLTAVVNMVLTR